MSGATRVCKGPCGRILPSTEEYFYPYYHRDGNGLRHICKNCDNSARSRIAQPSDPTPTEMTGCLQWSQPLERQAIEALARMGNVPAAAEAMGMTTRRLRGLLYDAKKRAAVHGWSPADDMTKTVPEGFTVKGVSTHYDSQGNVTGQWVKSSKTEQHSLELMMEAIQGLAEPFKGLHEPGQAPRELDEDLLAVYPMGDPHVGMYSWAAETGHDFNLATAERDLVAAVDHLVDLAPPAKNALIVNLGDFYHSDSPENRTARSGNALDVDSRYAKVLGTGVRIMRRLIDRALEKHDHVTVICEIGNHDDQGALILSLCLANYYEREARVTVDTSPARFHWYRFGACLIGVTHGHGLKLEQLPGVMACDRAKDWGETEHRYWLTGHVHHDSLKEFPGVTVETFRTLAPRDAWHTASGYRSGRDMKLDIYHRTWGRIARHVVGINRLERAS